MKKVVALVVVGVLLILGGLYMKKHKHLLPSGNSVSVDDVRAGDGAPALAGKFVSIEYTLYLEDGMTKVDSSKDRGQLFHFQVGAGQVVPGWDQGMVGMKVHGLRKIYVPGKLGYGAKGAGRVVPPNANLVYEVELKAVNDINPVLAAPTQITASPKSEPTKKAPGLKELPQIPSGKVVPAPKSKAVSVKK